MRLFEHELKLRESNVCFNFKPLWLLRLKEAQKPTFFNIPQLKDIPQHIDFFPWILIALRITGV